MPQPPRKHSLARVVQLIGEAETRREVILVGLAQGAAGADLVREFHRERRREVGAEELLRRLVRHYDLARGQVERVDVVVQRVRRTVVFPAQAVHQRELAGDFEIVLGIAGPVAEAVVLRGEGFQASDGGGQPEQEIRVGVAGELAGEGEAAEDLDSGRIRHVAIDEEVDVLQAELHGVAAVHPTQVVGQLRMAVVDRVEQVDIVAGKAGDAENRQVVDGAAGGQSLNAELLEDAVSGEIRAAGGHQDYHAGANFIEQVGPDREDIARSPEVHAALIVRRADGGGRQGRARARNIVIVLAVFVAQEDAVAVAEVVIELDLFGAVDFGTGEGGAIVRRGQRRRAKVRQREQKILRLQRLGTQERRGDGIPVERIDSGEGIPEGGEGGKIALAHRHGRHVGGEQGRGNALQTIEIEKEERLVAANRSADGAAVVVQVLEGLGGGEGVAAIGAAIPQIPEEAAVIGIGAGFGGGGDGAHAAELGARGEQVGGEFLNRFDRRLGHVVGAAEVAEGGLDPVHFDFDAGRAGARSQPLGAVAHLHHARHGERQDAGDQARIAGVLGHAAQVGGRLDDLARRQAAAHGGRLELHHCRCGFGDDDFRGGGRHFEFEVLAYGAVGFDGEGAGFDRPESFGVGTQPVSSGREIGKCVGSAAVGGRGAAHPGVVVGKGYGSRGDSAARGIDGQSRHSPERRLTVQGENTEK